MAKVIRKIVEIDENLCTGCGKCVLACQEGAIAIIDGKAKLVSEVLCDGLGACIGECPTGALKIVEKEAEEFSEEAVKEHLKNLSCGCPSHQVRELEPSPLREKAAGLKSALSHWPIQLRLIPVSAPFLEKAKILVCADCVAVAYPNLHTDLLPERRIMMGCPKFDPTGLYVQKLSEILEKRNVEAIEVAIMEVPCCKGLTNVVLEARKKAGVEIPVKVRTVSVKGEILKEESY